MSKKILQLISEDFDSPPKSPAFTTANMAFPAKYPFRSKH